jgi:hypothetical protein
VFNNSVWEGLAAAGLYSTVQAFITVANIGYGPFVKSAFQRQIAESVVDMSVNLTADDALLMQFWPGICEDRGWSSHGDTDRVARTAYLRSLANNKVRRPHLSSVVFGCWVSPSAQRTVVASCRVSSDAVASAHVHVFLSY